MMLRQRALLKDSERIEAARLAAERLEDFMRRSRRGRNRRQWWEHFSDSKGGVTSEIYRVYR